MDVTTLASHVGIGLALGLVPAGMMRRDSVTYGALATLAALVGYTFSGGYPAAAIAAVVLCVYQIYLKFAVTKMSWVIGTCGSLLSYLGAQAALLPSRIPAWESSFTVRVFVGSLGVAVAMLVACIEFKIRGIGKTLQKDLVDAAKSFTK